MALMDARAIVIGIEVRSVRNNDRQRFISRGRIVRRGLGYLLFDENRKERKRKKERDNEKRKNDNGKRDILKRRQNIRKRYLFKREVDSGKRDLKG